MDLFEDSDDVGAGDVEFTLKTLLRQLEGLDNLNQDVDVSPIKVREIVDFRCYEVVVRTVALVAQGLLVHLEGLEVNLDKLSNFLYYYFLVYPSHFESKVVRANFVGQKKSKKG